MVDRAHGAGRTPVRLASVVAWVVVGLVSAAVVAALVVEVAVPPGLTAKALAAQLPWRLVPLEFAVVGALIVSRRPGNVIGLLLFLPSLVMAAPVELFLRRPPTDLTVGVWITVWFDNVGWVLLIFPILFVLLLFPTGRPPGPRWRWLVGVGTAMAISFVGAGLIVEKIGPVDGSWTVPSPIGLVPLDALERGFIRYWLIALPVFTLLCAASLVVRYRRASPRERAQIRWLLYAGALFTVVYALGFGIVDGENDPAYQIVLGLSLLAIPTAIAIAILRHRLYDIDVIIRRTLQYGVLTAILGGLYFGSVLLVQTLLEPLVGGADTPPVVVVTTLALAALFNPLRVRVQRWIDRSFYRAKVDAERAVARFALVARNELDLDGLRSALFGVVGEALHPDRMALWLRESDTAARRVR